MKPEREVAEEFFEYDAEEFLVSLTLLITEGRTPECSVKGRTEGLHCPPAQSGVPMLNKHECSDKLPQCRQARRTRSEVMLLWRNHIPIMIEVMLLPDCCYSDEGLATDGTDLNDPAIKQDALLLERWTLQPVPRQSGDRFIEEKTLLLAVRSYVFFSQLSAWLSASHGIVPRNILYRISAADEELIWNFSQTPSEHAFPIPNVSHSVALKVRVQSLPRQPKYPVLKCSIHSGLAFLGKRTFDPGEGAFRRLEPVGDPPNPLRLQGSPLFCRSLHSPLPQCNSSSPPKPPKISSPLNLRKSPQRPESPLPNNKAVKWLYSRANGGLGVPPLSEVYNSCSNGAESSGKTESSPIRGFKSLSLIDHTTSPSSSPRPISGGETNPLIGSLLQERQEVIARIAQRLNFCDPTAPHLPDALFSAPHDPMAPKSPWTSSPRDEGLFKKTKDPSIPSLSPQKHERNRQEDLDIPESSAFSEGSRTSLFRTPLSPRSRNQAEHTDPEESGTSKAKPKNCRRLLLTDSTEGSFIAEAVQDISRLIQERLQQSQELLQSTYKLCREPVVPKSSSNVQNQGQNNQSQNHHSQRENHQLSSHDNAVHANGTVFPPRSHSSPTTDISNGDLNTDAYICTDMTRRGDSRPVNMASSIAEEPTIVKAKPLMQTSHKHAQNAKNDPWSSLISTTSPKNSHSSNGTVRAEDFHLGPEETQGRRVETRAQAQAKYTLRGHDENQDPWASVSSTPSSLTQHIPSPDAAHSSTAHTLLRSPASPLKPCSNWKKQNRHSIDGTATKAFHPCTGLPLLSSPVPQRKSQTGYFDLDPTLIRCKGVPWAASKRVCLKKSEDVYEPQQLLSASAPPASLSLLGNFEECVLNYRLEPLGTVDGFTAEVGASGSFCPSHMTFPVDVSFYSVSDDNAPSPYMGVINLESLGKRGYRVPPSGTIQVTLFNPNKTVVKMFVVMYDLRDMPASHQTFLRQRTFSVPIKRESNGHSNKKPLPLLGQGRTLRYLIHLRFQSSKSGKIYLHRDIRLLFSRKSMEVDSGAAYELKSFTESPADPPFSPRC
ncbi:atos homolog protein A [Hoplias malabaricus]|uniref:atos homolog protein A n=1 Tax=Hoplias malabaricus TaxID=27720 RepID=UPI0034622554